jgi:hypothetical protein
LVARLGSTLAVVLGVAQGGCSLVANLGDPKGLEPTGDSGAVLAEAGVDPDASDADDAGDDGDSGANSSLAALTVAVGARHACAVVSDGTSSPENGTIRCWGANDQGQLGSDPAVVPSSSTPLEVAGRGTGAPPQSKAKTLSLAGGYSCTTTQDTFLLCWGNVTEASGVTRNPPTPAYEPSPMYFYVRQLAQLASASMTAEGGCCTLQDTSLVCWGGDLAPSAPDGGVTLDGGVFVADRFETVSVGRDHACGIAATTSTSSRDVECWGANDHGQTGLPFSPLVSHPNHLGLGANGTLLQVATGGDTSCALFEGGALYCWGANDHGQLGTGTVGVDSQVPVAVTFPGSYAPIAVALGDTHACAVLSDRSVWCWGDDSAAQLGDGTGGTSTTTPSKVQRIPGHFLTGVTSIAAGGSTTCATLLGDPNVWCWGANDSGQAGQPAGAPVPYATRIPW